MWSWKIIYRIYNEPRKTQKTTVTFYIIIIIGKTYKPIIESNEIMCLIYISSIGPANF